MKFAHFEFDPEQDRLGEGPQAEVFRAVDTRLGRTVALKILRPHVEFDPEATTRFEREAKHTSSLEHRNIATVYEYGKDRGTSYIVMEFLEGQTLDAVLRDRTLSIEEGMRIADQVASALELVHAAHLIHRDLKPANIMVLRDGTVKLLDFGICRSGGETNITQDGMLVGTVLYMSPEQVRGQELDVRSDVFAFGSVFYHAFTGHLAFPGNSFPEVCMAILDCQPKRPSEQRTGFPPALEEFLLRCLAADPAERFASGGAMHAALLGAVETVKAARGGAVSRLSTRLPLRGRLWMSPLGAETAAGTPVETGQAFAAGLRQDLRSELKRSTGLDIQLLDANERPSGVGHWLTGNLELEGTRGHAILDLMRVPKNGAADPTRLEAEHTDGDEWGLQGKLVRSLARSIRKQLSEDSAKPVETAKRDPAAAERFAHHAHALLHRGSARHLVASISGFRRALDADIGCALAHAGMAEALVRKFMYWDGDRSFLDEAFESARRALALDSRCAEAHTSLGFAFAMTGMPEDALREYRLAIQNDNDEWLAHRLMGALLARQGNYKAASALLRRAISLAPHQIGSYDHLYHVLLRLDRYEEGIEVADMGIEQARKFLKQAPDCQEARLHLALLLARMGARDEARLECERAVERFPRDGYTLFHVACVLALLGDRDAAVAALAEAQARGYYIQTEIYSNTDLDSLREMPAFRELLA